MNLVQSIPTLRARSLLGSSAMFRASSVVLIVAIGLAGGCAPAVKPTRGGAPSAAELAELWIDPGPQPRSLSEGVADRISKPAADARYDVLTRDASGFSITYRVRDEQGRGWYVKIGPEAQTEVVSSRIVWALGYHEVPSYFVERWIAVDHAKGQVIGSGRFRPHDLGLHSRGTWSWQQNPFVGTRPYNGLLVLMMILNSTDLKNQNNEL